MSAEYRAKYFKTLTGLPNFWKTAEFTVLAKRQKEGLIIEVLNSVIAAIASTKSPFFGRSTRIPVRIGTFPSQTLPFYEAPFLTVPF